MAGYERALEIAERAALSAGEILRDEFHRAGGVRGGHGKAPVETEAEWMIRRRLLEAFPEWGYRGEETGPDKPGADAKHVWLVDPNDGTNTYLQGYRGSAISIGLVRDGVPVLGVVYAFAAPDDRGDLIVWAEGCGPLRRNGKAVEPPVWPAALDGHSVVLLSKGAEKRAEANARVLAPARFRVSPSIAYRLALVAAGDGVATVSLHSPGDWDYAAGHALIRAVGGAFVDETGKPVAYSPNGHSSTRRCFGGAPELVRELAGRDWGAVLSPAGPTTALYDLALPVPGRNIADPGILTRAHGCLMGQLSGDALGSLVEFTPADDIRRRYPGGVRHMQDGGSWNTIAGQPTDDSELALMLARSVVLKGKYDAESAVAAYRHWHRSNPFDCGGTTAAALGPISEDDVRRGEASAVAVRSANYSRQSNGSLMRVSPLAVWGYSLPEAVVAEHARRDAGLTHPHPVCRDAAAACCIAIARAISSGCSPENLYEHSVQWARDNAGGPVLDTLLNAETKLPDDFQSHQGWVLIALQNAFYRLLHSHTFEEGVVDTVMAGGDTDTNAAISGALLGAVHGLDAIPRGWRQTVLTCRPIEGLAGVHKPRPRCFWPVDALHLAERLLTAV